MKQLELKNELIGFASWLISEYACPDVEDDVIDEYVTEKFGQNKDESYWDKFAEDLRDEYGECLVESEDANEDNPYDYWLQDMTVADMVDFCKKYFD